MNERVWKVLQEVRKDARKGFTAISEDTGIPITTVHDYFYKLKEKGLLKGLVSLLDFSKLGFHFHFLYVADYCHDLESYLWHEYMVNNLFESDDKLIFDIYFKALDEKEKFDKVLNGFDVEVVDFRIVDELRRESFVPRR